MLKRRLQRGDTLIEVLFAVSVFSFVVVGALAIMNQGTAASQRALEITLVRQQIDAQAETLRFMHDSYVAVYQPGLTFNIGDGTTSPAEEWYRMRQYVAAAHFSNDNYDTSAPCPLSPLSGSFAVDPRNVAFISSQANLQPAQSSFAQIAYNSNGTLAGARGIWMQAVMSGTSADANQSNTGYIDFHIRACWDSLDSHFPPTKPRS